MKAALKTDKLIKLYYRAGPAIACHMFDCVRDCTPHYFYSGVPSRRALAGYFLFFFFFLIRRSLPLQGASFPDRTQYMLPWLHSTSTSGWAKPHLSKQWCHEYFEKLRGTIYHCLFMVHRQIFHHEVAASFSGSISWRNKQTLCEDMHGSQRTNKQNAGCCVCQSEATNSSSTNSKYSS